MRTIASQEEDTARQQVEDLACVFDQHALTYLEYKNEHVCIVLKREGAAGVPKTGEVLQEKTSSVLPSPSHQEAPFRKDDAADSLLVAPETGTPPFANPQDNPNNAPGKAAAPVDLVTAPLVGVAYLAKEPGAKPFVTVGSRVEQGATLCLIEAMKLFNEVKAPCAGIVREVCVTEGVLVEFDAPLFKLECTKEAH